MTHQNARTPYVPAPLPSSAEFDQRIVRLREELERGALEAVVLSARDNFEYFCGHRSMAWTYHARPLLLVVGKSKTVIVAPRMDKQVASAAARQSECEVFMYDGSLPDAADAATLVCQSLATQGSTIGIDYGHELGGRGSLTLVNGLSQIGTLVEAGDAIWAVRLVKSEFELEMMRISFDIANRGFADVIADARVGTTEVEMYRELQIEFLKNGAETVDPFSVLFGTTGFMFARPSSGRRLAEGDYIWSDFRFTYGGYPADICRTARVGTPSAVEVETYSGVRQVTIDICKAIRPGWTGGDVHNLFLKLWDEAGLPKVDGTPGRIGHGGGLGLTEPPSLGAGSPEVITEGMVLHVEPKLETPFGVYQNEDVVYIGADGNEFLSELSPAELPVINP